jgi:phage portal protein BeeE
VRNAAIRADLQSRTAALAIQADHGVISRNEWRRLEDMNAVAGGNDYLVSTRLAATPNPNPTA